MKETLHILGGGRLQIPLIQKARDLGYRTVISDYYENPPAKNLADFHERISTLDVEPNILVAKNYHAAAVLTCGTDQPVRVVADVSETLGLPMLISRETALGATNKHAMKTRLRDAGIPTAEFITAESLADLMKNLNEIRFPAVIKPVDSQGQRGVFLLNSSDELAQIFEVTQRHSRTGEVILESFYPGDEVSVQAWVVDGKAVMLYVTDRVTVSNLKDNNIGICTDHVFPSKYLNDDFEALQQLTQQIADGFNILKGPVYAQYIRGEEGYKVVEFGCRIGGGNELKALKRITGIDMAALLIDQTLGIDAHREILDYDVRHTGKYCTMTWLYGAEGTVSRVVDLPATPVNFEYDFFVAPGSRLEGIRGTARVGFVLIAGGSAEEVLDRKHRFMKRVRLLDENDNDLFLRIGV